jgi:phosphomannomutase
MTITESIFKAYDIRGLYPNELNEATAYGLARAYATWLAEQIPNQPLQVAVGMDMRLSSPSLKEQVVAGLLDSGVTVIDFGLVSTPTYYFAVAKFGYTAGIQISASHNPKDYNGFKLVRAGGVALSAETGLQAIKHIMLSDSFMPLVEKRGEIITHTGIATEALQMYWHLAGEPSIKPFKIVIDVANAMGALDYAALAEQLPQLEIVKLNFELNGTFPAHEADPLKPENLRQLQAAVVEHKADFGIAADGDSDRVFIVDAAGQPVPSPILYTLIAKTIHEAQPQSKLAYEIRLGRLVEDEFPKDSLVQTPVGHSLIKAIMLEHEASFGGEVSGHYFFQMPFGTFEAPTLLVMKLLASLTATGKTIAELVAPYQRYVSSGEINTPMPDRAHIDATIAAIKERYQDGTMSFIDGIKVDYPDYWFSVRASNTEPVLRLVVEARDEATMATKRDELLGLIRQRDRE